MNRSTSEVDFDDERTKIDKFRPKKIVLGQVRGD